MNKLLFPRDYISHSQMAAIKYSKQQYLDRYFYGKFEDSPYLQLGKQMGDALRFRKKKMPKIFDIVRKQIPEAKVYEKEKRALLGDIPMLGYFDGWDPDKFILDEYKTGKKPSLNSWCNQMRFYSTMLYLNNKRLPEKINLYWAETVWNESDQLVLTGSVKKYNIKVNLNDIIMFSGEIKRVWQEIYDLCEKEYEMFKVLPKGRQRKLL
jgi:hypothetical protein